MPSQLSERIAMKHIGLAIAIFVAGRVVSYSVIQFFHNRSRGNTVPDVVALVQEVNCLKNETVELKASLSRAVADLRKELDAIRRGVRSIRKRYRHAVQQSLSKQTVDSYHTACDYNVDTAVGDLEDLCEDPVDCIGLVIGKEPDVESMKGEPDVYFSPCVEPTVACTAACTEQDEEPMEVIVEEVCTHNLGNPSVEFYVKNLADNEPNKGKVNVALSHNCASIVTKHRTIENPPHDNLVIEKRGPMAFQQEGGAFRIGDRLIPVDAKETVRAF